MADINNPTQPASPALALQALGVAEKSELAGKNLDKSGDGKVSELEVRDALEKLRENREPRNGQPNLRLVQGAKNTDPAGVPAEMVPSENSGPKQSGDVEISPLVGVEFPKFYGRPEEAVRRELALTGNEPELSELDRSILEMKIAAMRDAATDRAGALLGARGLVGAQMFSLPGVAA